MECVFLNGSSCRALKIAKCSDTCKFRLTKEEFTEGQAKAKAILQKKGLKRVEIKTTEGVIVSTVKEKKNA